LGKFAYINECIKTNRIPEYIIIDNPFIEKEEDSRLILQKMKSTNTVYSGAGEDYSRMGLFSYAHFQTHIQNSNLFKKHSVKNINFEGRDEVNKNTTTITSKFKSQEDQPFGSVFTQPSLLKNSEISNTSSKNENINKILGIASFIPSENKLVFDSSNRISNTKGRISSTNVNDKGHSNNPFGRKSDPVGEFLNYLNVSLAKKVAKSVEDITRGSKNNINFNY
jgi:hypothetical protein